MTAMFKKAFNYLAGRETEENGEVTKQGCEHKINHQPEVCDSNGSTLNIIKFRVELESTNILSSSSSSSSDSESDSMNEINSSIEVEQRIDRCINECININTKILNAQYDDIQYSNFKPQLHALFRTLDAIEVQNYEKLRSKLKRAVKFIQDVEKQLENQFHENNKFDVMNNEVENKVIKAIEEKKNDAMTSLIKTENTLNTEENEEGEISLSGLLALDDNLQRLVPRLLNSAESEAQGQKKFATNVSVTDLNLYQDKTFAKKNINNQDSSQSAVQKKLNPEQDYNGASINYPIQLLIEVSQERYILNEDALKSILFQEDVKNRKIVVVSVVGRFRRGKSFLLNFMRRYFRSQFQGSPDWLKFEDSKTLEGFDWQGGSAPKTRGILLWPEPFLVGNDLAVLLLDTQGTFDGQTSPRINSFIFAISTMLSSVQVYNVSEFIQMDDFTNLQSFLEFGKLIMEQCNEKAFQKLVVLVRDWKFSDEKNYGLAGGQELLNEWMQNDEVNVTKEITAMLTSCFESISCYLLPHPGNKVSKQKDFKGDLNDMDSEFIHHMKQFIETILATRNLTPKRIGGNEIQAKDLLSFARMCVEELQKTELKAESILEEAACVEHAKYVNASIEYYKSEIAIQIYMTKESNDIETIHSNLEFKALEMYDSAKKFGGGIITSRYRDILIQEINQHFEDTVKVYMKKLELEKQNIVNEAFGRAKRMHKHNIESFIRKGDFSISLLSQHNLLKTEAIQKFHKETLGNIADDDLLMQLKKLDERMREIYELNRKEYESKHKDALMKLRDEEFWLAVNRAVLIYRQVMEDECGGEKICINITDAHGFAMHTALQEIYQLNDKFNQKHSVKAYENELNTIIRKEFLKYSKMNEEKKIEKDRYSQEKLQALMCTAVEVYETHMNSNSCKISDLKQLSLENKNALGIIKAEVYDPIIKSLGKDKCKPYIIDIKIELKNKYDHYKTKYNVDTAFKHIVVLYKNQITSYHLGKDTKIVYTKKQHEMCRDGYCKEFKRYCFQGPYFQQKINELPKELDAIFENYQKENAKNEVQIKIQRQNEDFERVKLHYKAVLDNLRVGDEFVVNLDSRLDKLQCEVEAKFHINSEDLNPSLKNQWSKLLQQMEDEFKALKTKNEKIKPVDELKKARNNGIMIYKTEMDDFLNSHSPDANELKRYHENVSKSAIQKFRSTPKVMQITQEMENEFKEILQNIFEKFEVKCSLKLREQRMQLPNNYNTKSYAIGIDLGTTHCCASVYRNDKVELILNKEKQHTTPSVVYIDEMDIYVGESAAYKGFNDPENCISEVKRIIGRSYEDPVVEELKKQCTYNLTSQNDMPVIQTTKNHQNKSWKPEEISAEVLKELKRSAELHLQSPVHDAVVTIPAYFTEPQRTATIAACKLAGLNVLRLLNEPTAAAITYGVQNKSDECRYVLVFDFGGGTCDVSILRVQGGEFKVLASNGDNKLGGEDFDNHLMDYIIQQMEEKENETQFDVSARRRLKFKCELAKRRLTDSPEYTINLVQCFGDKDLDFSIKRSDFEDICKKLFERALQPVHICLMEANLDVEQINDIVLAGGSSRLPKIRNMLKDTFNGKELNCLINPDEAIAHGAAIEAALLTGECKSNIKVIDITPFSLGIAVFNNSVSVIIPKNSPIPCSNTDTFTTVFDFQRNIRITVYQGENTKDKKYNTKLGEFTLSNLRRAKAKEVTVLVTFEIDANGILQVTVKEESVNKKKNEKSIVIQRKVC